MSLEVIYRDDRLVAIDKPAGLLVHRTNLDRHETRFAVQLLRDRIGQPVWPVHRLDKGTSGILLFALDPEAAADLGRQFERGEVAKTYWAVVRGHPQEAGEIDHPLGRMPDEYGYRGSNDVPQPAITRYRRLATVELPFCVDRYPTSRYALLELTPLTGRRHQLRRHMKHIAHPIVGDASHGKGRHNRLFQDKFGCHRLLLAAVRLAFRHPDDGRPVVISAPPGPDFADCLRHLGWDNLTVIPAQAGIQLID
ncbi:MAG: pseudouridylate synthase [Thiobacillus sp.]|nr:pseudouridylate synthase [Thiobacillus sp.]